MKAAAVLFLALVAAAQARSATQEVSVSGISDLSKCVIEYVDSIGEGVVGMIPYCVDVLNLVSEFVANFWGCVAKISTESIALCVTEIVGEAIVNATAIADDFASAGINFATEVGDLLECIGS